MVVVIRSDSECPNGQFDATVKPMGNGAAVFRQRILVPGTFTKRTSVTVADHWDDPDNPPWEEAHCHKGLTEGYWVTKGGIIVVTEPVGDRGVCSAQLLRMGESITFEPDVCHNVLPSSESEFVVFQGGTPVLNTGMDNPQDRFPKELNFDCGRLRSTLIIDLLAL